MRGRVLRTGRAETGKYQLLIEIEGDIDPDIRESVEIKPVKRKRSLNANAYFYHLISLIAEKLKTSVDEVHNKMLSRYGYPEIVNGKLVMVSLDEKADPNQLEGIHLKSTGHITINSHGDKWIDYIFMRGSHTFNTVEMAHLIDGVISEAQELGIDTMTPDEKARMLATWKG